jgi:hypothetical protein
MCCNGLLNGITPVAFRRLFFDKSLWKESIQIGNVLILDWQSEKVCGLYSEFVRGHILNAVESDCRPVIKSFPNGNLPK